jgi:GxxExxY protein
VLAHWDEAEYPYRAVTEAIIGAAIAVHRQLGPGFLESFYEAALLIELRARGLKAARQVAFPVLYRGQPIGKHVVDLLVEEKVVLELKHIEEVLHLHRAQLRSTLRATGLPIGLLINFNVVVLKDGVSRVVNTTGSSAVSASRRQMGDAKR